MSFDNLNSKPRCVYFDYNATSPVDESVKSRIMENIDAFGNPSSIHTEGRKAKHLIEESRQSIANFLGVQAPEIVFTGSGSESNNTVLKQFPVENIAISAVEHPSIINIFKANNKKMINIIPVDKFGRVTPDILDEVLHNNDDIKLVSIMLANNETGVINDIKTLAKICHKHNVLIHSDMVQALGRIDIDLYDLGVDFASFSGHKVGALKGIGALYIKGEQSINPLVHGGGQEKRRRSGTENTIGIVSFGAAIEILKKNKQINQKLTELRDFIESELKDFCAQSMVISKSDFEQCDVTRLPNTLLLRMPGVSFDTQVINFDMAGICVSAGSACSSGKVVDSHVLRVIGYSYANEVIRISIGSGNNMDEAELFINTWKAMYSRLKKLGKVEGKRVA